MSALAALGRTLADSNDRESWLAVHDRVIGASTAGKFAKLASAGTYARQILTPRTFHGNEATQSGHDWEPAFLSAIGAEQNTLFIHHPESTRFAATPDGTKQTGTGFAVCEVKAKHMKAFDPTDPHDVPTPYEIRQAAWQLHVIPEAEHCEWAWGELVRDPRSPVGWRLRRPVQSVIFDRTHPRVVKATALILPIADRVLELLDAALTVRTPF